MKKLLFLYITLLLTTPVFAQLEVKEGTFKEVPGFVNINPDPDYQTDDNDLPFAVLKVRTENINDKQRRELHFESNLAVGINLEYKTGEVWVYLTAKYADYLKISHPDLSSTEFYFPFDMKPKCGYELTLVNKSVADEEIVKRLETLEKANAAEKEAKAAEKETKTVEKEIKVAEKETKVAEKEVKPVEKVGFITVKTSPKGAFVLVDNKIVGITPYLSEEISVGNHKISVSLEGYEMAAKRVNIEEGKENTLEFLLVAEKKPAKKTETPKVNKPVTHKKIGVFSVSPEKQVVFAPGNVQYKSSKRRTFAENQWDGGSLFDFNGMQSVVDSVWFVLSSDEWKYLFDRRKTQSGTRYVKATVNGVFGVILLPDDWKSTYFDLKKTNITREEWMSRLEANGAVFLPAAGYRFGNWDKAVGTDGYYWSSDPVDTPYLRFNDAMLSTMTNVFDHDYGLSVRLVKEM